MCIGRGVQFIQVGSTICRCWEEIPADGHPEHLEPWGSEWPASDGIHYDWVGIGSIGDRSEINGLESDRELERTHNGSS